MDLDLLYKIAGLLFGFINIFFIYIVKTFWNLTFKKLEQDIVILKEEAKKNSIMRHDFKNVTNSVYARMDKLEGTLIKSIADGYKNVKELFNIEIKNIKERIDEKK
jgi:hypothetical protein